MGRVVPAARRRTRPPPRFDGTVRRFITDLYQQKIDSFGTTQEEHFRLYAGDRQIAEITRKDGADQTLYFHPDHLGSPETISDSNGAAYHQHFDPFGNTIGTPGPELTRVGFTGQDHDNDLGLIDMKGRVYDPLAARFMTADPVMQAPFWSQGLNRYSYVFNNPINNTDPSGFIANGGESTSAIMGWGGAVTEIAALSGFGVGAGALAGGVGIGALNPATSLLSGGYSQFDGGAGGSQSVAAPTTAPKGSGFGRDAPSGALTDNIGGIGAARRPRACDTGMCLAQATAAGEGGPGYVVRNDGTGGGVPVEQHTPILDQIVSLVGREVAAVINIIVSLEQHRAAYVAEMVTAPKELRGFPGTRRAKPKTSVQGGQGLRKRWVDDNGGIYEWDSQHGAVERYDKRGKHLGEFDAETGEQTKPADPKRRVEP